MANQRRAVKRRTHWSEMFGEATFTASGPKLLASSLVGHEGETLVRARGIGSLNLLTASAVGDGYVGAIGVAKVTTAAVTAGVGSIPTPVTEASWDGWLLHRFFNCRRSLGVGGPGEHVLMELDSKAMRKVNEDESIVVVAEGTLIGTSTATVSVRLRFLSMVG